MWGGNGRPQRSAHPAPRVPGAQRGDARPLIPRAPGPQDSGSASSSAAPGLGVLLVWEWLPHHRGFPTQATHVLTLLWDSPPFTARPRGGGQAPSGPRRQMGWARLAGPAGNKAEGDPRPKETPGSPRPVRVPSELQNPSPPGSASSGLPPAQESQRCPEQAPRFTSGGIFSQFSLLTFSRAVSINGSVLIITGPGPSRLQSPN